MSFNISASEEVISSTAQQLTAKKYAVDIVSTKDDALKAVIDAIGKGSSVMNGSSKTLDEIGYMDFLQSGKHTWVDYHAKINSEPDEGKRHELRRGSAFSQYYVGSVHALTQEGDLVIVSNTGSQLPHIVSTSKHLIFVVGAQKIVADLPSALDRVTTYVVPLENERMQKAYGSDTQLNKIVILKGEPQFMGRTVRVIIVREPLGF